MSSYTGRFSSQNITGTSKVAVTTSGGSFDSFLLASVHDSNDATVNLYYTSQVGTDITDTGANVNNGSDYAAGATSVAADGTTPTEDTFLNERVYKEDETFIGTCTAVHASGTPLTFSAGLEVALLDDENLHTGTRYYVLKAVSVPVGTALVLDSNDIDFNDAEYKLYITLTAGSIDLTKRQ